MAEHKLTATQRTEFGKGASRRLRRAGEVPAVLYGHGTDPLHISLPGRETFLLLRQANVLLNLTVEGEKEPFLALPKQVQRDVITGFLEHIDLVIVTAGEKVSVEVAIVVTGEAERGSMVNHELNSLTVQAPATDIPHEIEVSIEGLTIGDHLTVADLKLPAGVETHVDPETLVINVTNPPVVELETEEGDEVAEGEAAEAEGDEESSEDSE